MKNSSLLIAIATAISFAPAPSQAEVQITSERIEPAAATHRFQFKNIPAPSQTDAATNARIQMVIGREDAFSGDLDTLRDGQLPDYGDHPDANFFFDAGTPGGRITLDLGNPTDTQQINTYSWHNGTRGPQVYRLYGSNAAGAGPPPAIQGTDLQKAGWQLIASVDTRPPQGSPAEKAAGQYGVSISAPVGALLGKFRYLLFDIARVSDADQFGNTFFSEIDVHDGKQHTAKPLDPGAVEMVFDVSETPALQPWVDAKLRPACLKWYPIIAKMLESNGFRAPRNVTLIFHKDMPVPAATLGTRVHCNARWLQQTLEGEAIGAIIHELVHVIQHYGRMRVGNPNPVWLVEGVADYIRWFHYEPKTLRPHPDPARAKYTDSYRTTAAFLNYLVEKHDPAMVAKLNEAMRTGRYHDELWKQFTGKSVDQLWAEYVKTL
ncbi:MAG: hypothetical protein K8T91_09280 [Planctomycetes bacterium]|nr:hypothetical protein [Planctomycetota bacterium]